DYESDNTVVFMRILLLLACGTLGGTMFGFMNVEYSVGGFVVRAAGGLALAALAYMYTPTVLPKLKTPTEKALERSTQKTGDIYQNFRHFNSYWDIPENKKRYQDTKIEDRPALVAEWIGNDVKTNLALQETAKFLADTHACIQQKKCAANEL